MRRRTEQIVDSECRSRLPRRREPRHGVDVVQDLARGACLRSEDAVRYLAAAVCPYQGPVHWQRPVVLHPAARPVDPHARTAATAGGAPRPGHRRGYVLAFAVGPDPGAPDQPRVGLRADCLRRRMSEERISTPASFSWCSDFDRGTPAVSGTACRGVRGRTQRHIKGHGPLYTDGLLEGRAGSGTYVRTAGAPPAGPLAAARTPGGLYPLAGQEGAGQGRRLGCTQSGTRPRPRANCRAACPQSRGPLRPYASRVPRRRATCPAFASWGGIPLGGILGGASGSVFAAAGTLWVGAAGMTLSVLPNFLSPLRTMRTVPAEKAPEFAR